MGDGDDGDDQKLYGHDDWWWWWRRRRRKIEELDGGGDGGWFAQLGTRLLFGLPSCLHFSAFTLVSTLFLFYLFGVRLFPFYRFSPRCPLVFSFILGVFSYSILSFFCSLFFPFFYFVSALFSYFLCNEYENCGEVCICKGGKLWCLYVFYLKSYVHHSPFSLYFLFKVI